MPGGMEALTRNGQLAMKNCHRELTSTYYTLMMEAHQLKAQFSLTETGKKHV
jgi:hypothetical protein